MTITIRSLAPGPNKLLRMHWAKRRKLQKAWNTEVMWKYHIQSFRPEGDGRKRVEICRFYAGVPMDPDNLAGAAKIPLDALVHNGLIPDDSPEHIELHCTQEKVDKRADQRTEITITEIHEPRKFVTVLEQ